MGYQLVSQYALGASVTVATACAGSGMRARARAASARLLARAFRRPLWYPVCLLVLVLAIGVVAGFALAHARLHAGVLAARVALREPVRRGSAAAPGARSVVLLSEAYVGGDAARDMERARVVARNAGVPGVQAIVLLVEAGETSRVREVVEAEVGARGMRRVRLVEVTGSGGVYARLFRYANDALHGHVVVLHHADVYFDASVACAGLLRPDGGVALALSRHPSPDCVAAAGGGDTGWEPQDLCAGYHPVSSASHDAFAFVAPVAEGFVRALRDLRVNQFGAENVVLWNLARAAALTVLNPCANVHVFHEHCDARARGRDAHQASGSEATRRAQFGATQRYGWMDPAEWGGPAAKGVDCMLLGAVEKASLTDSGL